MFALGDCVRTDLKGPKGTVTVSGPASRKPTKVGGACRCVQAKTNCDCTESRGFLTKDRAWGLFLCPARPQGEDILFALHENRCRVCSYVR